MNTYASGILFIKLSPQGANVMKERFFLIIMLATVAMLLVGCTNAMLPNNVGVQPSGATQTPSTATAARPAQEQPNWPVLKGESNPSEAVAVKDAIKHSYRVQWEANWNNFDYIQIVEIYTNDPAVPLLERQRKFIQEVIAMQGDAARSILQGDGYLTLMQAGQLNTRKADENWARVLAKAKSEGRNEAHLTVEELRSVDDGVVGGAGGYTDPQATRPAYVEPPFDFKEVKVEGKYADVTYDDGAALYHAFLVKTVDGWKIAGTVLLKAHL